MIKVKKAESRFDQRLILTFLGSGVCLHHWWSLKYVHIQRKKNEEDHINASQHQWTDDRSICAKRRRREEEGPQTKPLPQTKAERHTENLVVMTGGWGRRSLNQRVILIEHLTASRQRIIGTEWFAGDSCEHMLFHTERTAASEEHDETVTQVRTQTRGQRDTTGPKADGWCLQPAGTTTSNLPG